jgi:hypothetical protein
MSLEYALVAALTALALLTAVPDSVQAQPLNEKVTLECDAFHKNADGSWSLSRKTDVNDGIYSEILEPRIYRKNEINVFGFDLTQVLEQDCSRPSQAKK